MGTSLGAAGGVAGVFNALNAPSTRRVLLLSLMLQMVTGCSEAAIKSIRAICAAGM